MYESTQEYLAFAIFPKATGQYLEPSPGTP